MNNTPILNRIPSEIKPDILQLLRRFVRSDNRLPRSSLKNEDEDMLRYLLELELITVESYKSGQRLGQPKAYTLTALGQEVVAESSAVPVASLDWTLVRQATEKYGPLGLRTAAQIAFGDSHRLDAYRDDPKLSQFNVWHQPDIKPPAGTNLVRVAGKMHLENQWRGFRACWQLPGHFLWDWDVTHLTVKSIGQRLVLIENPYAMWELMLRWQVEDVTLACIHGETLHAVDLDSAFSTFLKQVYQAYPNLETWIWCDPDLAGLKIATKVHQLILRLGGQPQFWLMDDTVLDQLASIILAETKLQAMDEQEAFALSNTTVHPELHPLAKAIQRRNQKGEQEGLVVNITTTPERIRG